MKQAELIRASTECPHRFDQTEQKQTDDREKFRHEELADFSLYTQQSM